MGWRSVKKSALSLSPRHGICGHGFSDLRYLLSLCQVSWHGAEPATFSLISSQSLGVLSSGLLRGELQPWTQSFGEASCFQWSLMLYLTPAEEKTEQGTSFDLWLCF